jgi:hypothetical protein
VGFNDPESMGLIGSEKRTLENKTSFDKGHFNDTSSSLPIDGMKTVENKNPPTAGFNDDSTIVDGGHISG